MPSREASVDCSSVSYEENIPELGHPDGGEQSVSEVVRRPFGIMDLGR